MSMSIALHQPHRSPWNHSLPAWIHEHESHQRLVPTMKRTLLAIAHQCDVKPDGSLVGAFGGQQLAELAGVSLSTLFRHIARFEQLGFVVTVGRGGIVGGRAYGNVYGIPAEPGALDQRRVRRRMQQMVPGQDGKYRPVVIAPGAQAKLWAQPTAPGSNTKPELSTETDTGGTKSDTGGRAKVTRPPVSEFTPKPKSDTAPPVSTDTVHGNGHGKYHDHGHGSYTAKRTEGKKGGGRMGHVDADDLKSDERLEALRQRAIACGLIGANEADRIRWFAAAEHALAGGERPEALFVWIVGATRRGPHWLNISEADEQRALRRLKPGRPDAPDTRPRPASGQSRPASGPLVITDELYAEACRRSPELVGLPRSMDSVRRAVMRIVNERRQA